MWWWLWSCGIPEPASAPLPAAPAPAAAPASEASGPALGAKVFAQHCSPCHGAEGRGDGPAAAGLQPPPADLGQPRPPEKRFPPSRMDIVRDGRPNTAMIGYGAVLTPEELAAVQQHVHTLAHGAQ